MLSVRPVLTHLDTLQLCDGLNVNLLSNQSLIVHFTPKSHISYIPLQHREVVNNLRAAAFAGLSRFGILYLCCCILYSYTPQLTCLDRYTEIFKPTLFPHESAERSRTEGR